MPSGFSFDSSANFEILPSNTDFSQNAGTFRIFSSASSTRGTLIPTMRIFFFSSMWYAIALPPKTFIENWIDGYAHKVHPILFAAIGAIPCTLWKARLKDVGDEYPYLWATSITLLSVLCNSNAACVILRRRMYSDSDTPDT